VEEIDEDGGGGRIEGSVEERVEDGGWGWSREVQKCKSAYGLCKSAKVSAGEARVVKTRFGRHVANGRDAVASLPDAVLRTP
jgi:hypothetical protein